MVGSLGYMTKTLSQIFFFLHQNQNIFFSNIGNQNIFLEENDTPPPPFQVKWSVSNMGPTNRSEHIKTRSSAKKICPLLDEQLLTNQ
jgi:hypothetical protein